MAGFLDRARDAAQRGLDAGKEKVDQVQSLRTGHDLLRKLGAAYYAEQRGSGTPESVNAALEAVEAHVRENGDAFLRPGSPFGGGSGS